MKIKNIAKKIGETITINGWVSTIRQQGSISFIILRDTTGLLQAVVTNEQEKLLEEVNSLSSESYVSLIGKVVEEKQAPGGYELKLNEIIILSKADSPIPIPVSSKYDEASQPKRLDWRWLDLRDPSKYLIFKTWTIMEQAFVNYCVSNDYIRIHSPKLMSTPSESGAELFEVEYFDRKAYLAQSPQFYKQMGVASGFDKVFEIGPVFRANPSFTSRHDTEFTGYDIEIADIESHHSVMDEQEAILVEMIQAVQGSLGTEIEQAYGRKLIVPKRPFPRISFEEAKQILKKRKIESTKTDDFNPEEERQLSQYIQEEYGHEFVFVIDYPVSIRPFYHMRHDGKSHLTKSFDLLWNGIEITTGAQREHRYEKLVEQAKEKGLGLKSIDFYLNFFKYGCPPHGGVGFGPSRMLMKIFDVPNVREVTYLYRGVKRLTP